MKVEVGPLRRASRSKKPEYITCNVPRSTLDSPHFKVFTFFSEEFLHSAQMMSQITPLEVDILFVLCDLLHQTG